MNCRQKHREHGFTLFELLIVMIMLGMLAGVAAPATGRFLDSLSFRKQTTDFLSSMRYARLMAISKGKPVTVLYDEAQAALYLSGAVQEERMFDLKEDAGFLLEPDTLTFYPEGQVSPGRLTVHKGRKRQEIDFDPLTALPIYVDKG